MMIAEFSFYQTMVALHLRMLQTYVMAHTAHRGGGSSVLGALRRMGPLVGRGLSMALLVPPIPAVLLAPSFRASEIRYNERAIYCRRLVKGVAGPRCWGPFVLWGRVWAVAFRWR